MELGYLGDREGSCHLGSANIVSASVHPIVHEDHSCMAHHFDKLGYVHHVDHTEYQK